jgi:hypothetical protein
MKKLLKIADQYKGGHNVTMFIPRNGCLLRYTHLLLVEFRKTDELLKGPETSLDEKERQEVGQIRRIISAVVNCLSVNNISYVSPMGLILYGGIKRCGAGFQMYVESYEPKNNPITKELCLIEHKHFLRDHDDEPIKTHIILPEEIIL